MPDLGPWEAYLLFSNRVAFQNAANDLGPIRPTKSPKRSVQRDQCWLLCPTYSEFISIPQMSANFHVQACLCIEARVPPDHLDASTK